MFRSTASRPVLIGAVIATLLTLTGAAPAPSDAHEDRIPSFGSNSTSVSLGASVQG